MVRSVTSTTYTPGGTTGIPDNMHTHSDVGETNCSGLIIAMFQTNLLRVCHSCHSILLQNVCNTIYHARSAYFASEKSVDVEDVQWFITTDLSGFLTIKDELCKIST